MSNIKKKGDSAGTTNINNAFVCLDVRCCYHQSHFSAPNFCVLKWPLMVDDSSVTIFGEDSQRKRGEKELHPSLQPLFHHFFSKTRSSMLLHQTPFQESLRQDCTMCLVYKPKCLQFCTHHDHIDDEDDCHSITICRI